MSNQLRLLNDVSYVDTLMSKETIKLSNVVKDTNQSSVDRISAFEDIINIEVGDTSLSRARNIEREIDLRQIYLKFEGGNPSGTHKDRIAFAQCLDALRRGFNTVAVATCGNYGVSMALASNLAGLRCMIYIPENYHTKRFEEMENLGATIIRVKGNYEHTVMFSRKKAKKNEYYDTNPGGQNTTLQLQAYGEIAFEIYDVMRDAPKIVAAPVSNGTMLAGVYRGFVSLFKRGKTSRIPRIVAASTNKNNPIVNSVLHHQKKYSNLNPALINETIINEPLINWKSFDGTEAFNAVKNSNGYAFGISDHKMVNISKMLKTKEGLNVLPASTAGLAALFEIHKKEPFEGDRYVAILTGKK